MEKILEKLIESINHQTAAFELNTKLSLEMAQKHYDLQKEMNEFNKSRITPLLTNLSGDNQ